MRRIAMSVAAATVLAVSLVAAGHAGASTTKCKQYFCAHVVGTGLHVDWVQTYSDVPPGETYKGFFSIYTRTDPIYRHDTRWYKWSTPTWYVAPHRYYSVKVKLDMSFPNGTKLYIAYNKDGGFQGGGRVFAMIHN